MKHGFHSEGEVKEEMVMSTREKVQVSVSWLCRKCDQWLDRIPDTNGRDIFTVLRCATCGYECNEEEARSAL